MSTKMSCPANMITEIPFLVDCACRKCKEPINDKNNRTFLFDAKDSSYLYIFGKLVAYAAQTARP